MHEQASQRYAARLDSIKHSLDRLNKASNGHFFTDPENITWADVTVMHDIDEALKELCEKIFNEGEYAK